jgi:hypothetical protein
MSGPNFSLANKTLGPYGEDDDEDETLYSDRMNMEERELMLRNNHLKQALYHQFSHVAKSSGSPGGQRGGEALLST